MDPLQRPYVPGDAVVRIVTAEHLIEAFGLLPDRQVPHPPHLVAALAYWSAWRTLPINFPKNDLARIPSHWLSFGARISPLTGSPRLSVNPPNAMLNYFYAVLESEVRLAVAALGLDPGLGVLHVDSGNRDSLALDVLEPVRAQVDSYLLDWVTRQPLKREWFFEQRDGNCRLMGPFAVRLSETAAMWRRAVAPIAEWVAQALWNSHHGLSRAVQQLPTRLTHRRRSEGRGNDFRVQSSTAPRHLKICEVCGAEGVKNRYCHSCAVDVSRETMTKVALFEHVNPKSKKTKARISRMLSDHAVANSWWDSSSLPSWLSEEYYVQKIQPRLRTIKVREISEAIRVSKPYAALVRGGRRRPHPRHWQTLRNWWLIVRAASKSPSRIHPGTIAEDSLRPRAAVPLYFSWNRPSSA
jgi:CRISPR associated protein, Cas1 family